jgi:hypothetical protein
MSKEKSTPKSQEEELVIQDENNGQEHQTTECWNAMIRRITSSSAQEYIDWIASSSAQEYIDWKCKYCNRQDENDEKGI